MKMFEESMAFEQRKNEMNQAKKVRVMGELRHELDQQVAHKKQQK